MNSGSKKMEKYNLLFKEHSFDGIKLCLKRSVRADGRVKQEEQSREVRWLFVFLRQRRSWDIKGDFPN